MNNAVLEEAWKYHNRTKHSPWSIRATPHYLDWANQPIPLKIYTTLEPIPLPRETRQSGIVALSAIAARKLETDEERTPTIEDLAHILYFSAGITKHKQYPGGEIYFRAASCTGALYEIELYVVCASLPGLDAGVYHFNPGDFALRRLRSGDYRAALGDVNAPVVIVCTGTYWRNAWKYRARTYRHFGWDNGTLLANMLAMTAAYQYPGKILSGFVDDTVNTVLDVDTRREVSFSMVTIGHTATKPRKPPEPSKLNLPTAKLSASEVDYPELHEIHDASSLTAEDIVKWPPAAADCAVAMKLEDDFFAASRDTIEQVILRRGSTRRFSQESITGDQLLTILCASTQGVPADFVEPFGAQLNDLYLIVNAVEGFTPGAYFYNRDKGRLECLREGNFRSEASHLGLEQALPGDAAADVFFLADLSAILSRFGNRGYRTVQLEAGIIGGKLYLGAYSLRLGATGLTFYDDEVTQFFSPHAKDKNAIFLVAVGKSAKRAE